MTVIQAENVDISIHDGTWRLISASQSLTPTVLFQVTRGSGVIEYSDDYGREHHLPGTVLSVGYVRAVVIGYEDKFRQWKLGFHVARNDQEKSRWLELVCWPPGDNEQYANAAQHAGRELAEHIGCPLKIFGAKKLPQRPPNNRRSGVTGPLVPHKREDIGPQRVKLFAQSVQLPVQHPGIWLGRTRGEVTLRLSKDVVDQSSGRIAPAFNQCVINAKKGLIHLLPPTGLLGNLFGGPQGRELEADRVQNVELRHTISRDFEAKKDNDGTLIEVTYIHYIWEIFLTLPDEGILLAQTTHSTSSDLARKRSTVGNKFSVNTKEGIEYLRQHQEDQEAYETAETFARTVAVVIASELSVRLVKTEINETGS